MSYSIIHSLPWALSTSVDINRVMRPLFWCALALLHTFMWRQAPGNQASSIFKYFSLAKKLITLSKERFSKIEWNQGGICQKYLNVVYEFFLLHKYRGTKVSKNAAVQGFERHKGRWEIVTHTNNNIAISFWRIVISNYTKNNYSEKEIDHIWGRNISFNFN